MESYLITLRDYQLKSHELIIENFKQNKKVLLSVMAGGGKSITAGAFVAKYFHIYKFVLMVRKRDLVEQLAKDALETFEVPHSIFMAGHPKLNLKERVQVCSKDTMMSRDKLPFLGEENVVIMVDECDEFPEFQRDIIDRYFLASNRVFYFGMTATPFNGLDFFDIAIEPITPKELLRREILVPFSYYIPKQIDFSKIAVKDGQFSTKDIMKKMNSPSQIKFSFEAWLKYGDNRQTLIFCINQEHSKEVVHYINSYYGKEIAVHCDAETSSEDRQDAIAKFKRGEYRFLSNVRLFTRGTNIVEIGCIWDDAPTLSLNLHIQKIGRGSRKNDFYKDCILIDNANNLLNNGHFYQEREIDLASKYKKTKSDLADTQMRVCVNCFRPSEAADFGAKNCCPYCGTYAGPVKKKKLTKYKQDKIFMEQATEEQIELRKMVNEFKKVLWKYKNLGNRYRHDIAIEYSCRYLLRKYPNEKVLKIQKSISLTQEIYDKYKNERN